MQRLFAVPRAHNIAGARRAVTFSDWQAAARAGYVAGGARPDAADAIVTAAADDVAPLVTRELTGELLQTFMLALDLECGRYVRRRGAAMF
jgi:hypothetical protein